MLRTEIAPLVIMPVVVDSRNEGGSSSNAAGDVVVSKIKSSSKTNRSELVVESKKKAVKRLKDVFIEIQTCLHRPENWPYFFG